MKVLIIDTSYSNAFSLGLLTDGFLFSMSYSFKNEINVNFWKTLEKLFEISKVNKLDIDVVSVSVGPGPFTSLRNGISIARTLSQINNIPLTKFSLVEVIESMFYTDVPITLFDGRAGKLLVKKPNVKDLELVKVEDFKPLPGAKIVSIGCRKILNQSNIDFTLNFDFLPMDAISEVVRKKIDLKEFYHYNELLPLYYKNPGVS